MMRDRIESLRRANTYNLHFPRHVVTNIEVLGASGGEVEVVAAYIVYQTDLEGQTRLFSVGQYRDIVSLAGPEPLFREKLVVCDTFAIPNLLAIPL
jgi:3-phenylpropionate/cinnamic acid dioxygenase small subunit